MLKEFVKGLWKENPVLVAVLGMCPTLAVTTKAINGFAMGMAVLFVLTSSSIIISLLRKIIPHQVRIPSFIVIIATFVTIVDLFFKAKFPDISKALGPFIPLIIVNCIILARQEAFASKNPLLPSILDAVGMSLGFTWVLLILGAVRELFGFGTIFGYPIMTHIPGFKPILVMILPPGAFITLGVMKGIMEYLTKKWSK